MVKLAYVPLMPIQDAAKAEGLSVRQLYRMIKSRTIDKYRREGDKRTFVDPEQVRRARGFRKVSGPPTQ